MSWDIMQKPKDMGGLGVGDLIIKNAALLFKCGGGFFLWRGFTVETGCSFQSWRTTTKFCAKSCHQ